MDDKGMRGNVLARTFQFDSNSPESSCISIFFIVFYFFPMILPFLFIFSSFRFHFFLHYFLPVELYFIAQRPSASIYFFGPKDMEVIGGAMVSVPKRKLAGVALNSFCLFTSLDPRHASAIQMKIFL